MNIKNKKILCEQFSSLINPIFLFNVMESVLTDKRMSKCINEGDFPFADYRLLSCKMNIEYYVALSLSEIHWYYKGNLEENLLLRDYSSDLSYISKIKVKFFKETQLVPLLEKTLSMSGSTYFPIIFSIDILSGVIYRDLKKKINANVGKKTDIAYLYESNALRQIVSTIFSVVQALNFNDVKGSMALLRSLIDLFLTMTTLRKDEMAIKEYYKFMDFIIYHSLNNDYPDDCKNEAKKEGLKAATYANFGWLKIINPDIKKDDYSINGVVSCCLRKTNKNYSDLMYAYGICNSAVHLDMIGFTNDWDGFCFVCDNLSRILFEICDYVKEFLGVNKFEFIGIDLIENLKIEMDDLSNLMLSSGDFYE